MEDQIVNNSFAEKLEKQIQKLKEQKSIFPENFTDDKSKTGQLKQYLHNAIEADNDFVRDIYTIQFNEELESLCLRYNPSELIPELTEIIKEYKFPTKTIYKNQKATFYRARIGKKTVPAGIDDCNATLIIPYHGKDIGKPPALRTEGGRFNRNGTSYLYLSTNLKTCIAEVHLQVGQECSVGAFRCINKVKLIDLSKHFNRPEIDIWRDFLLQPIHREINYLYKMTQLITDVFVQLGVSGIYFDSTQTKGKNIVCFKDNCFELIEFSEKIYKADKIDYKISLVEDSIRKYYKSKNYNMFYSFNQEDDEENESEIKHFELWIENERKKEGLEP